MPSAPSAFSTAFCLAMEIFASSRAVFSTTLSTVPLARPCSNRAMTAGWSMSAGSAGV